MTLETICGKAAAFQSTLSMRRATRTYNSWSFQYVFQSTLSMRRATGFPSVRRAEDTISIHALHEESDYLYIL